MNLINPFGILFHPRAIERFLTDVISENPIDEESIVVRDGRFHYLFGHSQLSADSHKALKNNIGKALIETREFLKAGTHLILTLGTAWGYRAISTGNIVANCHKLPQHNFKKFLSTTKEIEDALTSIVDTIVAFNPAVEVLFTISPVRHLKDGFVENQRSKAHLIAAVHSVIDNRDRVSYFPAYEIVMDELRDYRFYERDLLHPNSLAIDIIWEKFVESQISEEAQTLFPRIEEIYRGQAHRPNNPNSQAHEKFLERLAKKEMTLRDLLGQYGE